MNKKKGCGIAFTIIGTALILGGLLFALAMYSADESAGEKNEREWEEYNSKIAVIDSLKESEVNDTIIEEIYPQPMIRQGGFATLFGLIIGIPIAIIGGTGVVIGVILYNSKKAKREEG